jgi:hypothetical protein
VDADLLSIMASLDAQTPSIKGTPPTRFPIYGEGYGGRAGAKSSPVSEVPRAERCFPKTGSGETQEKVTEKDALGWNRQRRPEILRRKRRRASVYLWRAAWRRWPGRASIQLSARHAKKPRDDKAVSSVVPAPFKMSGESLSPNFSR